MIVEFLEYVWQKLNFVNLSAKAAMLWLFYNRLAKRFDKVCNKTDEIK